MSEAIEQEEITLTEAELTARALTQEYRREVSESIMPSILIEMLSRNLIDLERAGDRQYLFERVIEHSEDVLHGLEQVVTMHSEFLSVAQYAIDNDSSTTAVILIATAIEHSLNIFYRQLLASKGLSSKEITQIIRNNNIQSKTNWLLSVLGEITLSDDMKKKINTIIELRNAIVHYKAVPFKIDVEDGSNEFINNRLENLDLNELITIPDELDILLNTRLVEIVPNRRLALELTAAMFPDEETDSES